MPQYYIRANQSGCYYELYVNGVVIFTNYKNVGLVNHETPINHAILQSGVQKVTVKLFPLDKMGKKEYETLTKHSRIEIDILKLDKAKPNIKEYKKVKEYKITNFDDSDHDVRLKDLPYYEHTFTFNAKVPYVLKGWSDSQDLTKMDQDQLEKEIVAFHNKFADIIYNQDQAKWLELVKNREEEFVTSVAYNDIKENNIKRRINDFKQIFNSEFKKKEPLQKYKMIFGSGGKTVALKSVEEKGVSAFSFGRNLDDLDGEKTPTRSFRYLYLHKPKGSNNLEIIK